MIKYLYLIFVLLVSGCANTNMKTYVDPEHQGKSYSKVLIDLPNANFEFKEIVLSELCGALKKRSVVCLAKEDLLPPTREYSDNQLFQIIEKNEIEGWLVLQIGSGGSSSQYIGSQTFGSATLYGNSAYGSANSMAMYSFNRQQGYSIVMYDMHTKHKAFIMEASTSASGLANITNSVFAESLASKIIKEMESNGFLN
ncbi:hypothetical protein [Shewanella sp.]|uniref:hypothetical protein n=1 Tax=Shewanella sp. TaxID=50422 RepID=UPI0040538700